MSLIGLLRITCLKKRDNFVFSNDDRDIDDIDSDMITFSNDGLGLVTIELLIISTLVLITLVKMILKLLLLFHLLFGVIDLNNVKYKKKWMPKVNA